MPDILQKTNTNYTLEVACFDIASAVKAAQAGADRIEFCDNAAEGGTTQGYGSLKLALDKISIPVFPIIRPRGGDFLYTGDEFNTMLFDVEMCRQLGFKGVVIGLLNADGTVDKIRTTKLVEMAGDMQVTFHRAFDRAINPLQALEDVIESGCKRILTSGQVPIAPNAKQLIKELIDKAAERILIMPGSGVRSNNIADLASYTGAKELHSSARKLVHSEMKFLQESMQEILDAVSVDEEEIKKMKQALTTV